MTTHPILAPMRAAKLKVPAQEQFSRRPRSFGPDVERRAESGIRPGGEPQATDPHLLWVDLSGWGFPYVRLCVYTTQGSGTSLSRGGKKAGNEVKSGIGISCLKLLVWLGRILFNITH